MIEPHIAEMISLLFHNAITYWSMLIHVSSVSRHSTTRTSSCWGPGACWTASTWSSTSAPPPWPTRARRRTPWRPCVSGTSPHAPRTGRAPPNWAPAKGTCWHHVWHIACMLLCLRAVFILEPKVHSRDTGRQTHNHFEFENVECPRPKWTPVLFDASDKMEHC